MTSLALALLLQVWEPPPPPGSSPPQSIKPPHQGFSLGLSLGIGDAVMSNTGRAAGGHVGACINALIGYSLRPDVVLALKIDTFNADVGNMTQYGAVLQYWFNDDFTVLGGVGGGSGNFTTDTSLALLMGVTWNAWRPEPHNAIGAYLDVIPTFSDPTVVVIQAGVGWQFF